jgi:diaminopimelate epimerase
MQYSFVKMNGAGNDFVIFDARKQKIKLTPEQIRVIASRKNKITNGCDQLIMLEPTKEADVFMRIYNADGGEVNACGNATRCVGWLMMQESNNAEAKVRTNVALLQCSDNMAGSKKALWKDASGLVAADMGEPKEGWQEIPLGLECDTLHVPIEVEGLRDPVAVSMGNPHVVFFVDTVEMLDRIVGIGPALQNHPLFPDRVNVSIAYVIGDQIQMRVWERGVGLTASCGTAACAVGVAANRREMVECGQPLHINLKNGADEQQLMVWQRAGHVFLHGPVVYEFEGTVNV